MSKHGKGFKNTLLGNVDGDTGSEHEDYQGTFKGSVSTGIHRTCHLFVVAMFMGLKMVTTKVNKQMTHAKLAG